jgi:hypothetical protein
VDTCLPTLLALCVPTLFCLAGCHGLQPTAPVKVVVRDAETRMPIPGAEVALVYPADGPASKQNSSGRTGPDGIVQVQAVAGEEAPPRIKLSAENYLAEQKGLPGEAIRGLKETHLFSRAPREPVEVVYDLYSGPEPTVELVVPTGYRGVVKAEVRVKEEVVYPHGQRKFTYTVPPSGIVEVAGPAILLHGKGPAYQARYADGTPLPIDARELEVGLRWLRSEGRNEVFVVGTRSEWEAQRRASDKGWSGGGHRRGGGR